MTFSLVRNTVPFTAFEWTEGAITVAVTSAGSDTPVVARPNKLLSGDYSTTPFLTLAGALACLPKGLRHSLTVNIGAGTFAGASTSGFVGQGSFNLFGTLSAATLTTGVATGTAGAGSGSTTVNKPAAAANWTAGEMRGMVFVPTSGGGSGTDTPLLNKSVRIRTNTTTQIFLETALAGLDGTTVFAIKKEGTIINGSAGTYSGGIYDQNTYALGLINSSVDINIAQLKVDASSATLGLFMTGSTGLMVMNNVWLYGGDHAVAFCSNNAISNLRISSSYFNLYNASHTTAVTWIMDSASFQVDGAKQFSLTDVSQIIDHSAAAFRAVDCSNVSLGGDFSTNVAGTPVQLQNIQKFSIAGALTGTNAGTTRGISIAGGGQYNMAGGAVAGSSAAEVLIEDATGAFSWAQILGNGYTDYKGNFVIGGGSGTAVFAAGTCVYGGSVYEYGIAYKLGNAYGEITAQHTAPSQSTATQIGLQQTVVTGATANGDAIKFFGDGGQTILGGLAGTITNATANWIALYPQLSHKIFLDGVDYGVENYILLPPGRIATYDSDSNGNWHVSGGGRAPTLTAIGDQTPHTSMTGVIYNNITSAADITINLPASPPVGTSFSVRVGAAHYMKFLANTGQTILLDVSSSASAGFIRSNAVGSCMTIEAISSTVWICHSGAGSWTVDA